jgi:putative DNA methylase
MTQDTSAEHLDAVEKAKPNWRPNCEMPKKHRNFQPPVYGMDNIGDIFTPRQLQTLNTICDIIIDIREQVFKHSEGDTEYTDAIIFYLACALSRMTDYHNNLTTWNPTNENVSHLFQRQAIPMAWDFCEANPIDGKLSYAVAANWVASALDSVPANLFASQNSRIIQLDARFANNVFSTRPIISTDPPYYDNISYADLSDFFYVWLRKILSNIDSQTFSTVLTPKESELIVSPHRHNGSEQDSIMHFRNGFSAVFSNIHKVSHANIPITVYYAFKQQEEETDGNESLRASTGWETMLEGLVNAGFQITGTWPVRTTKKARAVALGTNALASAVVLVARQRGKNAPMATRKELATVLRRELPVAFSALTQTGIAPVDLAQAAIGPGIAVFSRYSKIIEADGSRMSVRAALQIINQELDAYLNVQTNDLDQDTSWAVAWFEQYGMNEGEFGQAETLSRAKGTAVNGLVVAGIVTSHGGKVRLLKREELLEDWDPATDNRLTVWEATQYLIQAMDQQGESGAASLLKRLGGYGDAARDLAYRLFNICEKNGWSAEALAYNSLVVAWPELTKLARAVPGQQMLSLQI